MIKNLTKTVGLVIVIATLAGGCRSTTEYKKLTEAGSKYTTAVNDLLLKAGDIRINATSEQLLKDDRITNQTVANYEKLSQLDEKRLDILNKIRIHNQLLQSYFSKLQELANSDAPEQTKTAIDDISNNLNAVGKKLQESSLIANKGLIKGGASLIIDSKIHGALREELEKRNQTIRQELTIQKEVLNALGESMQQDVELIKSAQEERLVIRPLTQSEPISKEDEWIQTRNRILSMNTKIAEVKSASTALGEFQDIYEASVQGKLSIAHLNNVLQDIDSFIALVENNK
jgi:hypothetical protein